MSSLPKPLSEASRRIEELMLVTPFPLPVKGAEVSGVTDVTNRGIPSEADVSQEQLTEIWLLLNAPSWTGNRVALMGFISYLTLLIRLARSHLDGRVSGAIFSKLVFEWARTCGRFGVECGFRLGQQFDNLVDQIDRYPELEREKVEDAMVSDFELRSLAARSLDTLLQVWETTKNSLQSDLPS